MVFLHEPVHHMQLPICPSKIHDDGPLLVGVDTVSLRGPSEISRALLWRVTKLHSQSNATTTLLRKPMRKSTWTKHQNIQATEPDSRSFLEATTADFLPMTARSPWCLYANAGGAGASRTRAAMRRPTYTPICFAAGATPGTGRPLDCTALVSPMTKTFARPGTERSGRTRTLLDLSCSAPSH